LKLKLFDVMLLLAVVLILTGTVGGAIYGIKHPPPEPPPVLDECRLNEHLGFADVFECDRGNRQCVLVLSIPTGNVSVSCVYR